MRMTSESRGENMITLRGAEVSEKLKVQVQEGLSELGRIPRLAIVRVGERPDDISYEKGAVKKMDAFGLEVVKYTFPENISDREFKAAFREINENPDVDGILVLRPLPEQIVQEDIDRMIHPLKDLDGISPVNIAKVFSGDNTGFAPCTAEAVMDILRLNDIPVAGRRAVIVGRSMVVGRPLAMLFLQENATVTVCHTRTVDLPEICRSAQILVAAAGCAKMVDRTYVGEGAIVVDVGINVDENGHLCGDVDFEDIREQASMATPVPGGIGSVTTAVLAKRLVNAALAQARAERETNAGL
ncbi:UNVERIFIED_ORG: bifunctional 5,10-methylene-tetrahydrofolate dehydrogenase/5,10-methylene-tetrahydrofolate cyclohydrolase [Lacrimispora saccharolytica]|nr:tetrahydrofolate dehydrogenase/cyclohydrolase, NAD(P)-binding domain protein [Clostridium sp. M62/1]RHT55459.1 bifunctional 5,10-methylenetetrahydrofolate dehydrogenase/5,10-methenyltetrahydrofolate cyclohydrolase [Clostridium sp. AM29-11AC]CBK78523.1 methenyltetrahydrofolate cyclohydrolase /5,10-methylenetetrahydrofolate dehydrogenase (NADP+) [[Clostridium] cf. saccharolyticum K10]CBL36626.1 methenyltetrahydrofolate cyclohydrolase /5,10-methylenetetrahydrofolate dehydrogenase (NADP+) [butyra